MDVTQLNTATNPPDGAPCCIYCAQGPATTLDHVVPRCLFGTPPSPNLVTVPACDGCNGRKSTDDTFLRDYLTADLAGNDHPTAAAIFDSKVKRSIKRNQSELANVVRRGPMNRLSLRTPAGLYMGEAVEVPLPDGRIASILFQMARGLYFDSRKTALPQEIPYEVLRYSPDDWDRFASGPFKDKPAKILGDVFECAFICATEDPSITLWLMRFYRRLVFIIETGALVGGK